MKKQILSTLIILMFSLANAQDKPKPDFGVKAGFNCAYTTKVQDGSMRVRYHIGAFTKFPLSHKISLQPEILYSGQGVNVQQGNLDLNYLLVPVLLKYYIGKDFHLEFGPQYGFLTSAKATATTGGNMDATGMFKRSDLSLDFGATYTFDYNYIVGLRYNLGLTQLQKNLAPGEAASRNSVLQISIGYKF